MAIANPKTSYHHHLSLDLYHNHCPARCREWVLFRLGPVNPGRPGPGREESLRRLNHRRPKINKNHNLAFEAYSGICSPRNLKVPGSNPIWFGCWRFGVCTDTD